ncbi:MAG: 30S ribosomal protein S4 [Nanoarchaeota archaeon]
MGDPKRTKKKFETPRHPWVKEVIDVEKSLIREYGLKNKKEIWKAKSKLRHFMAQSKDYSKLDSSDPQIESFLQRIKKLGIIKESQGLDDVLGLEVKDVLERRLQTIVYKKGLANSVRQARQFIVHNHVTINGVVVNVPGYIVGVGEENAIGISSKSPLANETHPEIVNAKNKVEVQ